MSLIRSNRCLPPVLIWARDFGLVLIRDAQLSVAVVDRTLAFLACGDVAYEADEQRFVAQGRCPRDGQLDRELATCMVDGGELQNLPQHWAIARRQVVREAGAMRRAVLLGNDGVGQ